jgi:archaetidylinositol phosphate synthase
MASTTFQQATRMMGGVTANAERRLLLWIAPRLPRAIHSDHLTALALAAMGLAGAAYWLAGTHAWALWLVSVALVVNWFGDSLDGTLARVRQQQRPRFGFYIDHLVDAAGTLLLIGGMALSGYLTPMLGLGLIAAYYLLMIEIYLATHCLGEFRMSVFRVGATELRIFLIAGNAATFFLHPSPDANIFGVTMRLFDPIVAAGIAGMGVAFIASAVRHTRALLALKE